MAIGRDRLAALDEVADDGHGAGLVPQVFGRAAAGQDEPVVGRRIDVVEPEVGFHAIPGLLGVGIEAGVEVMDDGEEDALLGRDDVHLPPFLFEPELGVVDLLRLARVAGQQQDLEHGLPALEFTLGDPRSPSPHRLPAPLSGCNKRRRVPRETFADPPAGPSSRLDPRTSTPLRWPFRKTLVTTRPRRLAWSRTHAFHACNTGSNPVGVTWAGLTLRVRIRLAERDDYHSISRRGPAGGPRRSRRGSGRCSLPRVS